VAATLCTAAMQAMGDKVRAREIMTEANVPVVPGSPPLSGDPGEAARVAGEIGYPILLKAAAGGGGKGMRIVRQPSQLGSLLDQAQSEATSAFGDGTVFIEKFIEEPRHIEIQVLGDAHGNLVYLWERECSIQRRHQKVIEEAPSPFLDEATRRQMGEQAVALAKAVDYESAGTVEFIGVRRTLVRAFDGTLYTIPNGELTRFGNKNRDYMQAIVSVELAYEQDAEKGLAVAQKVADDWYSQRQDIALQRPEVHGLLAFGESGLTIRVVARVQPLKHWEAERELRNRLKKEFDSQEVEIPFARRVVYLRGDGARTGETRAAEDRPRG